MAKRFFWLSYPSNLESRREKKFHSLFDLHRLRDGPMASVLSMHLGRNGYDYGGVLLNLDPSRPASIDLPVAQSLPDIRKGEIVFLPTRPPLHDDQKFDMRHLRCSETAVESRIHQTIAACFQHLSRNRVVLAETVRQQLDIEVRRYCSVEFTVKQGASIKKLNNLPPGGIDCGATLGYLYAAQIHNGPRVLAAFAMGGIETFLWSQILANRSQLLKEFICTRRRRLRIERFRAPSSIKYPHFQHSESDLHAHLIADVCF